MTGAYTEELKKEYSWSEYGEEIQKEYGVCLRVSFMGRRMVLLRSGLEVETDEVLKGFD